MGRLVGVLAVILAAMLWGTTGTTQALLPEARVPLVVGALRLLVGALALLALAMARGDSRRGLSHLPWPEVLFAGVAIGLYNLLFFYAVSEAGVGVGTAVTIGSAPIWATLWEVLSQRRLPAPVRLVGQALSVIGVGLLGFASGGAGGSALGVALALMAGACYAGYSLATSRAGGRVPSTSLAAATFCVAALLTLPVLFVLPLGWLATPSAWGGIVFLGVAATALAYALYTWGLTRVAASTAVTLALAEPVTAWLLATLVVAEPVTLQTALGAVLILIGLVVVTVIPAKAD